MNDRNQLPHLKFTEFDSLWNTSAIGDIFKNLRTGMTPSRYKPQYYDGDNLWITSGELNYNYIEDTNEKITNEAIIDTNLKLYPPYTLFIAITGLEAPGTRGKCGFNKIKATTNQSCMAFTKNPFIDLTFLFFWYQRNSERLYFHYAQGTKQQSFNNKIVEKFLITYPEIEEQKKIAKFLSSVDKKIKLLKKKKDILKDYKKGVMQQIFSQQIRFKDDDRNDYPKWEEKKLGEICELHHGYQFRRGDFVKDGLAIIKIGNVIGHELNLVDLSFIESNRYDEFKKFEILAGDILMSLTGNIGRVIEVKNVPFTLIQNYRVGKFVPFQSDELKKPFLKYLLESNMVFGRFNQLSNQSAQANFGKQDMDKINILLPCINEQIKIADFLSALNKKIQIVNNQIEKTQKFKQGLLQQMFV